ncbi:hypothetical protein KDA82_36435, partial [Streptomyces daliensis]|nr:hypothetical protein [Streptomyces daliensis]
VALTVADDGASATGWVQGLAAFMPSRTVVVPGDAGVDFDARVGGNERPVGWDMGQLSDAHLLFALRVALSDVHITVLGSGDEWEVRLVDDAGSWARVTPAAEGGLARYGGTRRLIDEVERAWDQWCAHGRPELYDYGLTVTDEGRVQYAWAWDPAAGPRWPLTPRARRRPRPVPRAPVS